MPPKFRDPLTISPVDAAHRHSSIEQHHGDGRSPRTALGGPPPTTVKLPSSGAGSAFSHTGSLLQRDAWFYDSPVLRAAEAVHAALAARMMAADASSSSSASLSGANSSAPLQSTSNGVTGSGDRGGANSVAAGGGGTAARRSPSPSPQPRRGLAAATNLPTATSSGAPLPTAVGSGSANTAAAAGGGVGMHGERRFGGHYSSRAHALYVTSLASHQRQYGVSLRPQLPKPATAAMSQGATSANNSTAPPA